MQSTHENGTFHTKHREELAKLKKERETVEEKFGAASAEKRDLMSQLEVKLTNMEKVEYHNHRARVGREEDRGTL